MAWIESHQELARHPKTRRLARGLGVSVPTTIGHLHLLWWWALDYAEDGDLSGYSDEDIADAALWEGGPSQFVAALMTAGFLEEDRHIHDWWEYAQRWIEKRRANAERMRAARAKPVPDTESLRAAHVQRTLHARAGATGPNRTKPNLTGPEPETRDDARTATAVAPPMPNGASVPKKPSRNLAPLVDAFRAAGLSPPKFTGAEAKAAADLMAHWTPAQLAACWQDHASGEYGDDFSRRELSFGYLSVRNRVGNWHEWQQPVTAPSDAPVYRNGLTVMPRDPGVYAHGVRCECGHVYSIRAIACPQCAEPKADLPQIAAAQAKG